MLIKNGEPVKIIYDIGANNGNDIEYYLKKADLVIAVEANPQLCELMKERFSSRVLDESLVIENYVVTDNKDEKFIDFYIHQKMHVVSTVLKPENSDDYELHRLPAITAVELIEKFGDPHYVKIDIEGYDAHVLRNLFSANIKPPFISVESHKAEIFAMLQVLGGYDSFQLVDGPTVGEVYENHKFEGRSGQEYYSFPPHSAGPFGADINGHWMNAEDFHVFLGNVGFGWKDIHATTEILPRIEKIKLPPNATFRMKLGKLRRYLISKYVDKVE